jgi:hypothetical protein
VSGFREPLEVLGARVGLVDWGGVFHWCHGWSSPGFRRSMLTL